MVYPYNGIFFGNKEEVLKDGATWMNTKAHILYDFIYMYCPKQENS